jgi:uncharacterized C2H2 Zn-finger protein
MVRKVYRKRKKGVARRATPKKEYPTIDPNAYAQSASCEVVISHRHAETGSWDQVCRELGGVNPGTVVGIARGRRKPSNHLIDLINLTYGSHIPFVTETIQVARCPKCGRVHEFKKSCSYSRNGHHRNGHVSEAALYLRALKAARRWLRAALQHADGDQARRESARMIGAQVEALIEHVELSRNQT